MKAMHVFSVLLLFPIFVGCPSLSTMQTVDTVPEGEVRLMVAGGGGGVGPLMVPQVEAGVRVGVADDADIGGKVYATGAEIGIKHQILQDDFKLSVAPALGITYLEDIKHLDLHLPLLMGVVPSEDVELNFGPKFGYIWVIEESPGADDDYGLAAGGYLALLVRTPAGIIVPEVNVYSIFDAEGLEPVTVVHQLGVGLLIDL